MSVPKDGKECQPITMGTSTFLRGDYLLQMMLQKGMKSVRAAKSKLTISKTYSYRRSSDLQGLMLLGQRMK